MTNVRLLLVVGVLAALACKRGGREVVAYTSVDQVFAEPVFRAFEHETGIAVRAVYDTEETKSTGVLNRLLAEAARPRADVFWSGDPVRPFVLMRRGLVTPYVSANAAAIPAAFRAGDGAWTGVAARARVLLVNRDEVAPADTPRSLGAFLDPRWKGRAAIANPIYGTTTMHAAALFATWGDERARTWFEGLKANDVRIASSNGEVKRLVVAGEVAFGLTDTDDAQEAVEGGGHVEMVFPDQDGDGTLVMPTSVVLIRGGPNPETGRALIDYLVSANAERQLAERGAHMPLRGDVATAPKVGRVGDLRAMKVDYGAVAEKMEALQPWLRAWTGL
jgi:iron(III) transport system substrate-binding protein